MEMDAALPPKVFPETVTGVVEQVLPPVELNRITGGLVHGHVTSNIAPMVTHPAGFLTAITWLPLAISVKTGLDR